MTDDVETMTAHVSEVLRRHAIASSDEVTDATAEMLLRDGASARRLPSASTVLATHQVAGPASVRAKAGRAWARDVLAGTSPRGLSLSTASGRTSLEASVSLAPSCFADGSPLRLTVTFGPLPGLSEAVEARDADALAGVVASVADGPFPALAAGLAEACERFSRRALDFAASQGDGDVQDAFLTRLRALVATALPRRVPFHAEAPAHLERLLRSRFDSGVAAFAQVLLARDFRRTAGYHDYPNLFPLARSMTRRHTLFVGPTNSGKTHRSLSVAVAAATARVLSPLRLLALEHYERLRDEGLAAGMVTGEEVVGADGATHVAHTVETAPLHVPCDVAVVDEVQMLADRDRGWAWTQAIVGMPARHVVMTGSPDVVRLVTRICAYLGEELEVIHLDRLSPLQALPRAVPRSEVARGDAVVAFSRRDVYAIREEVVAMGLSVATVYGALSPEVRRAEARRFREGEADVLVATDAIGMGLNIGPLRRVLFSALTKFDGERMRGLEDPEIRQVAGRAGRYGMQEVGFAGVLQGLSAGRVTEALTRRPSPIRRERLLVRPSLDAVRLGVSTFGIDRLAPLLDRLVPLLVGEDDDVLEMASLDDMRDVAVLLADLDMPAETAFHYAVSPLDRRHPAARAQLKRWASAHVRGGTVEAPRFYDSGIEALEFASKSLTHYLWLGRKFPEVYDDRDAALVNRARVDELIERELLATSKARVASRGRGRGKKAARA